MQAAYNSILATWRLFRPSKNASKKDRAVRKETSAQHLSKLLRPSHAVVAEPALHRDEVVVVDSPSTASTASLVKVSTSGPTATNGDVQVIRHDFSSSGKPLDPKAAGKPLDNASTTLASAPGPSRVNDYVAALKMHRTTNQHVLQKTFEVNSVAAPLFSKIDGLISALDTFVHETAEFTATLDPSDDRARLFREVQEKFTMLRDNHFTAFQTGQKRLDGIEHDIIHSLVRSGRYMDRVLRSTTVTQSGSLSPEPTLFSVQNEIDIGGETVARSASVVQYLSQLGDVDAIQEKLTDLYLERDQLLDEQESRNRFGLSLDDESLAVLQTFAGLEKVLLDELEYAEIVMDALRELVHDKEALEASNEAYISSRDENPDVLALASNLTSSTSAPQVTVREEEEQPLLSELLADNMTFEQLYDNLAAGTGGSANFIDVWMLHRARSLPVFLRKFASRFTQHFPEWPVQDLRRLFLEIWFNDSAAADYDENRILADERSMLANITDFQDSGSESTSSLPERSEPMPLLKLGRMTTSQDIIAHAMQTRGITTSQTTDD